jgi:hypothetical protein
MAQSREGMKEMAIFINGDEVKIPLNQLIAEGREIIEREGLQPSKTFDESAWAASVAVARYDEAHRRWVEERKQQNDSN